MSVVKQWAVIGAGPAGIIAVGKLLDSGVPPKQIVWCDPNFECGDMGRYWQNVPSNTTVALFEESFHAIEAFQYKEVASNSPLSQLGKQDTCLLSEVVTVMQVITDQLLSQVTQHAGLVTDLSHEQGGWCLQDSGQTIAVCQGVILAIGSEATQLDVPGDTPLISLYDALNPSKLKGLVKAQHTVGIFGSSHSAVLCLRACIEIGAKVAQFYRDPIRFACPLANGEILFNDTGLKGEAASWARENLFDHRHPNLTQYPSNPDNIAAHLNNCDWQIHAVGLQPKKSITIDGIPWPYQHTATSGILAPGLFGFGVAFPEQAMDSFGHREYRVGLLKFVHKLERYLALWQAYH